MDVLRKAFGDPFMELVHPTGRKRHVPKEGLKRGKLMVLNWRNALIPASFIKSDWLTLKSFVNSVKNMLNNLALI